MKLNTEKLYLILPPMLQNILISAEGHRIKKSRYSHFFFKSLDYAQKRDYFDNEMLVAYQIDKLKRHLFTATKSIYWKNIFSQYKIDYIFDDPFNELKKLPILNKNTVKEHYKNIIPSNFSTNVLKPCHTSGTTGSGLNFWETEEAENEQWAIWWRYRIRHAIKLNTWCMYFGSRPVVPSTQKKPPFWRINYPGKQLFFSSYHLNEKTAIFYLKKMRESKFPWIHGFPSSISRLAQLKMEVDKEPLENLKWITTGSENLLDQQRTVIKEAFGIDVIQHYGLREAVANISQCEYGNLHIDEDFSFVEFLPVENTDYFRIIGTNWSNPAFPLLRYDTGDICRLSLNKKCSCGRNSRIVEEIDGRKEDFIILPNGCFIGRLSSIFKDLINIREAQIVQKSLTQIEFRIVRGPRYNNEEDEKQFMLEAIKRLGNQIDISIIYVDSIPRTSSGKLRFVISELQEAKNF